MQRISITNEFNYHSSIIQARNELDYKKSDKGLCYGIAHVAMAYTLKRNLSHYNQLIDTIQVLLQNKRLTASIEKKQQDYLRLLQSAQNEVLNDAQPDEFNLIHHRTNRDYLNESEKKLLLKQEDIFYKKVRSSMAMKLNQLPPNTHAILKLVQDIHPFYNSIECYQRGSLYPQLGLKNKFQYAGSMMELLLPPELKHLDIPDGQDMAIDLFSGTYSVKELEDIYFTILRELIDDHSKSTGEDIPIALILECSDHEICVAYDKKWIFINASKAVFFDSNKTMAENVHKAMTENETAIFMTKIYVPANCSPELKAKLKSWFGKMEAIFDASTSERATRLDSQNCNWLHIAAFMHHPSALKTISDLLKYLDPNTKNLKGYTALALACHHNLLEVVALLLKHPHIDPNLTDEHEETPLINACAANYIDMVKLLLEHPQIDPNIQDEDGNTALMIACKSGHFEIAEMLLIHEKINIHIKNKKGYDSLHLALTNGHSQLVKSLIAKQADVNAFYSDGTTPIFLAIKTGNLIALKMLLENKAYPNVAALSGRTPLLAAVRKKNSEAAKMLLSYGANPNCCMNDGRTALDLAISNADQAMIDLLRHYNVKQNENLTTSIPLKNTIRS